MLLTAIFVKSYSFPESSSELVRLSDSLGLSESSEGSKNLVVFVDLAFPFFFLVVLALAVFVGRGVVGVS